MARLSRTDSRRLSRAARVALAMLVVLCPLLLGSVPTWAPMVELPLAVTALALAVAGHRGLKVTLFGALLLGLFAVCLAQLVPLPPALLGVLSPPAEGLREFALVPIGLTGWRPVTLDVASTWREVGKASLLAAAFFAAVHASAGSRRARGFLLATIAAVGAGLVVIAMGHAALGLESLFGVYTFSFGAPRLFTPFGNPNHLASFLILSGTLAVALAIETRSVRVRGVWLAAYALCCVGVLLSLSRAGIVAYSGAQAVLFAALLLRRRAERSTDPQRPSRPRSVLGLPAGLALLAVLVLVGAALFFSDQLVARFTDTSYGLKLDVWPPAWAAALEHWRTGMGRGSFELAFTRFPLEHLGKTFTHPENLVLQLACELGLPLGLLVLAVGAWALVQVARATARTPLELAVVIAVGFVALHNLFDFNLEFPGVAVPLAIAFGVVQGPLEGLRSWRPPQWPVAAALAALGTLGLVKGADPLRQREAQLVSLAAAAPTGPAVQAAAMSLFEAHPADYLPWQVVAAAYVEKPPVDPQQALAFANRALYLAPDDAGAHQAAARALRRLGNRGQALLEYRLAYTYSFNGGSALQECTAWARSSDDLLQCVPMKGYAVLHLLDALLATRRAADAGAVAVRALGELPDQKELPEVASRGVAALTSLGRFDDARAVVEAAEQALGPRPELALARATVLSARGQAAEAAVLLDRANQQWPESFEVAVAVAETWLQARRPDTARGAIVRANALTTDASHRSQLRALEARCDFDSGLKERAVEGFRGASRLSPQPGYHYSAASVLMQLARYDDAWAEVRAGQRLDGAGNAAAVETSFKLLEEVSRRELDRQLRPGEPDAGP